MTKSRDGAMVLAGTAAAVFLVAGLLYAQHLRHGWPFSLHHGMAIQSATTNHTRAVTEPQPMRAARATIELEPSRLGAIGVRIERARKEQTGEPLRVIATIVPDETRVSHVHTRVAGWIEKLYISTTGQTVRAGQPLAAIFSQELLSSQS